MLILKIFRRAEWDAFRAEGVTAGAPIDLEDGFIHFSTPSQVAETAARHFATESNLVLVAVDVDRLGDALKWEPSRGGQLFPHLYRALTLDEEAELKRYTESLGLIWISTPFSRAAADWLETQDVPAYKIGSGEADNLPLIRHIARKGKPVIMSTGMQTIESIRASVDLYTSTRSTSCGASRA